MGRQLTHASISMMCLITIDLRQNTFGYPTNNPSNTCFCQVRIFLSALPSRSHGCYFTPSRHTPPKPNRRITKQNSSPYRNIRPQASSPAYTRSLTRSHLIFRNSYCTFLNSYGTYRNSYNTSRNNYRTSRNSYSTSRDSYRTF